MYMYAFFETKEEAKGFQKEIGCGALYSNAKGSRTKSDYAVHRTMMQDVNYLPEEFYQSRPYCVAWNADL